MPQPIIPQPNLILQSIPSHPFMGDVNMLVYERREAAFEKQDIKTLHAACKVLNIEVLRTESENIQIAWDETASWRLSAEQRGDCLQLNEQNFLGFHDFSDFFTPQQRRELRIALPKDYSGALILENETGSISITNITADGRIELKTTVGHIRAKNLKTNSYFRADTQTGGMDISKIDSAEYFHVTGSVGQIIMDGVRSDKIEVNTSGLVDCRKIYADAFITINTSTGGISCSIDDKAENYTAHCHSVHGFCNLPNTAGNGPKVFHASTNIGDIDVRFRNAEERASV